MFENFNDSRLLQSFENWMCLPRLQRSNVTQTQFKDFELILLTLFLFSARLFDLNLNVTDNIPMLLRSLQAGRTISDIVGKRMGAE